MRGGGGGGGGGVGGKGGFLYSIWATERFPMVVKESQVVKFRYNSESYALHQLISSKIKTKIKLNIKLNILKKGLI